MRFIPIKWDLLGTSRSEAIAEILWDSHRKAMPLRRAFLQTQDASHRPGKAATFVAQRRARALDLFLLIHAGLSSPPFTAALPTRVWAPLAAPAGIRRSSAEEQFRTNLEWLHDTHFIRLLSRDRDAPVVQLLDEGTGSKPYAHPADTAESYLALPHTYWEDGWDRVLDLSAKFVLLIALSLRPDGFLLPGRQAGEWYGVSAATIQRGLASLREAGLLRSSFHRRPAAGSPWGERIERRHTLVGPFRRTGSEGAQTTTTDNR